MDLRAQLLAVNSKENSNAIARFVGSDEARFAALLELFFENEYRVSQRAAMVVGDLHRKYPYLIIPHLPRLVANLRNSDINDAVKRNSVRILQEIKVPEDLYGEVADICFGFLANPNVAVAIRAFSMTVCWNICREIPELMPELRMTIEDWIEHGSSGFKSRGRKILKAIAKYEEEHA